METRFQTRPKNDKESYIQIALTVNGKKVRISIPPQFVVETKHWAKGFPVANSTTKNLRQNLTHFKNSLDGFINDMVKDRQRQPTETELRAFCTQLFGDKEETPNKKLVKMYQGYVEQKFVKRSTVITARALTRLFEFAPNLEFPDINYEFDDKFTTWLLDTHGLQNVSVNMMKKRIKAFFNWCVKNDHLTINPGKYFELLPEIEKPVIAVTPEEKEIIENTEVQLSERLTKVKDLFLFSTYSALRYSDTQLDKKELKKGVTFKDKIHNGILRLEQTKTSDPVAIPLLPQAIAILEKYDYVLPIISNQKANEYLQELFTLLELDRKVKVITQRSKIKGDYEVTYEPLCKVITFHKGRKTFCTTALQSGIRKDVVMKISGHKSEKVFQKYVDYTDNLLTDEMSKMKKKPTHLKVVV